MKHFPVIILVAVALMGCTQTSVQPVSLTTQRDSVNYALGYIHGGISCNVITKDSTGKALKVFVRTFDRVSNGSTKKFSSAYRAGYQLGLGIIDFETTGLSHNPYWPLNEDLILQGFVAGYYNDTTTMTMQNVQDARNRVNTIQSKGWSVIYDQVRAKRCPNKPQAVVMENKVDSANYAYGWMNGYSFGKGWAKDSTFCFDDCIAGVNKALRQRPDYPAAMLAALRLANMTDYWTQKGLDGKNFPYNKTIYRQALLNGLQKDTITMKFYEAATYLNQTLPVCLPPAVRRRL